MAVEEVVKKEIEASEERSVGGRRARRRSRQLHSGEGEGRGGGGVGATVAGGSRRRLSLSLFFPGRRRTLPAGGRWEAPCVSTGRDTRGLRRTCHAGQWWARHPSLS
jgi:hypothetical protein